LLYFSYTARLNPDLLSDLAPSAEFAFIAHLPEWRLTFPYQDDRWSGGLPSAEPGSGTTVWGAVFEVTRKDLQNVHAQEESEGRTPETLEVMDRNGRRHEAVTHLHNGRANGQYKPSTKYLYQMLRGSRHWNLPAGWIAGLEEHLANP